MTLLAGLATEAMLFWVAAVIAGLCMGSSQSVSRPAVRWPACSRRSSAGYPMAITMMVFAAVVPYLAFRRKGWL